MRAPLALLALWTAVVMGCGAQAVTQPPPPAPPRAPGHPDAPPTLAALPELPATAATERTHQGILVARQTLDVPLPEPPGDRSFTAMQHWAVTEVASWIALRQSQTDAAAKLLLEGTPSADERIVSHAVLALLHEDTAAALAAIPAPKELDSEHEIAAMYRDLMREQANSFSSSALLELRECANLAYRGPADMRLFAGYCHARFDRLQGEARARTAGAAANFTGPQPTAAADGGAY